MKKVLVLGAHLDDSVIAMGGTIRKLVKSGCEVHVFCFGNGDEAYIEPGKQKEAVERFKLGGEKAHEILGCKTLECFDVGDFEVNATAEYYRQCIGAIRKYQPEVIFGHDFAEYFQHHGMARMSIDAWNQVRWNCTADYGTEPWFAKRYFQFEVEDVLQNPSHYVDITDEFEDKMAAMAQYDAEGGHLGGWQDVMQARARFYGSRIGVKYAEVFRQNFYLPEKVQDVELFFK